MAVLAIDSNGLHVVHDCATWELMDKSGWTLLEIDCGNRVQQLGRPFAHGDDKENTNTGDKHFHHIQTTVSSTWTVVHNLNKYPSILVRDSAGTLVEGEFLYDSLNQMTLNFSAAFSGMAELN